MGRVVIETYDIVNNLKLVQGASGVKASLDGLLLARFVSPSPEWRVADLGCGNGLVGLLIAVENPHCRVLGVEIQRGLVARALQSSRLNGLTNIRFVRGDLRDYPWPEALERFDLVLANPPYRKTGTGRLSPHPERAAARHEIHGNAGDFAAAAAALLRDGGASTWIYLAERYDDLRDAVTGAGLEPVRRRFVVSREGDRPSFVLLEALKGEGLGKVFEEEPLVIYRAGKGRDYTEEAREILYGR